MYGEATFLSFKDKIKDVLESEGLSYDVAKTLYQSEGMISLESVNVIQGAADEKTKAQILMDLLQGQIMEDKSRFKAVVSGMMEFADLKPIMEKMTCECVVFTFAVIFSPNINLVENALYYIYEPVWNGILEWWNASEGIRTRTLSRSSRTLFSFGVYVDSVDWWNGNILESKI